MRPIFVGYACNNSCVFCAQGGRRDSLPEPSGAEIRESIRAAAPGAVVAIQGGEPTLRPELLEWIALAKNLGARRVVLQTNARRLVYPDYARSLADAGLDAVDVSLNGATSAQHDYHTGVPGGFLQTVGGLDQARKAGIAAGVTTVVTRSNFRHLPDIARLAATRGAKAIHLDLAAPRGKAAAAADRVVPLAEMAVPWIIEAVRLARELGLGVYGFGLSRTAETAELFAGLGEAEPEAAPTARAAAPGTPRPSKPAAGLGETRLAHKKTGDELRAIFPGLFGEPEGARG